LPASSFRRSGQHLGILVGTEQAPQADCDIVGVTQCDGCLRLGLLDLDAVHCGRVWPAEPDTQRHDESLRCAAPSFQRPGTRRTPIRPSRVVVSAPVRIAMKSNLLSCSDIDLLLFEWLWIDELTKREPPVVI
jgi:hypothetical protein